MQKGLGGELGLRRGPAAGGAGGAARALRMASPFERFRRGGPAAATGAESAPSEDFPSPKKSSSRRSGAEPRTPPKKRGSPKKLGGGSPKRARAGRALPGGPPKGLGPKFGKQPLRLLIVGHNPSAHAWATGHYYSNPSNWMWKILPESGVAPAWVRGCEADDRLPEEAGIGFVDVGCGHPGTESAKFSSEDFKVWAEGFYRRLSEMAAEAGERSGCTCGRCGQPAFVAFSGKRQYLELMNVGRVGRKLSSVTTGPQEELPPGWPLQASQVWVCTSTSGASALTNEARLAPYRALAEVLREVPWPRPLGCLPG